MISVESDLIEVNAAGEQQVILWKKGAAGCSALLNAASVPFLVELGPLCMAVEEESSSGASVILVWLENGLVSATATVIS